MEEGVFLIKRTDKLPKRGNGNYVYVIEGEEFEKWYLWRSNGSYEEIPNNSSGGGGATFIESGTNVTITGSGTEQDPFVVNSLGGELEKIAEGANIGYALRGRTSANYGNIGSNAIDFSISNSASSTKGATGARSVAFGLNNTVAYNDSFVAGSGNTIPLGNNYSAIFGIGNTVVNGSNVNGWNFVAGESNNNRGGNAVTFGWSNDNNGHSGGTNASLVTGFNNTSLLVSGIMSGSALYGNSISTAVFGQANLTYSGNNGTINTFLDPIFIVGNGTITSGFAANVRSDAFKILLNGLITASSLTIALIDAEATGKVLITKEYLNSRSITNETIITTQTALDLNTLYPTAVDGFEVKCPNVDIGGEIYKKTSVVGQWMKVSATNLNP